MQTSSRQIRQQFIDFFEQKQHRFVRSSPVVPLDDPTLLFTNAGMNQFKDVFLATGSREYTRAANSQKCIRASGKHNDLEDVGRDHYHHTFFEMLGNWSFGDYFKQESIVWAWELITEVWKLPKERLWATVFAGDDKDGLSPDEEAEALWKSQTDINPNQVLRFGKKDNFWEMGEVGPCGPCSELHFDLGEQIQCPTCETGKCGVNQDGCWRFVELWNLVFIQFNRVSATELNPLPAKHVDTGMGLERVCRVLQGVDSNYDTDLFTPIIAKIAEITQQPYVDGEIGVAFRVISDHLRSLSFAIADGAIPSNEGRGYVLRRMLRRATRFGRVLGMHRPFIYELVPTLVELMGEVYPELKAQQKHVTGVIRSEEESFGLTLDRGLEIFERLVEESQQAGSKQIKGEDAFKLYDTFGFPIDLTRLMCDERGLQLDEAQFEASMQAQRTRAREASKFRADVGSWTVLRDGVASRFLGYETFELNANITKFAQQPDGSWWIVLDQTPFYAESGGQVGDTGLLRQGNLEWKVTDVRKEGDDIIHLCQGDAQPKDEPVQATIDLPVRQSTTNNHTATHLLQAALKQVLGNHVNQAGSVVHPHYLRFDFTHFEKLTEEQLQSIETIVNEKIRANLATNIYQSSYDEAINQGVTALFGEKYGEVVRIVQVDDFSKELCGGCHVNNTAQIGSFRILSESAIASGVRRIVAVTGAELDRIRREEARVVQETRQLLNVTTEEVPQSVRSLLEDKRRLEKEIAELKKQSAASEAESMLDGAQIIQGSKVLIRQVDVESINDLKSMGDGMRQKLASGLALLAWHKEDKATLLCVVSDDLVKRGVKAGDLVNQVAALADGRGGGKPHMAQAGAKTPEKLPEALKQAPELVENYLAEKLG